MSSLEPEHSTATSGNGDRIDHLGIGRTAAVIVNWNSTELVKTSAQSIIDQVTEIVVVDNASATPGLDELRSWAAGTPTVQLVCLDSNQGFAGATNSGTQLALDRGADAVLWLNSDATMTPGSVAVLRSFLDANPKAAAASPAVMAPDNVNLQHTSCSFSDAKRLWGSWDKAGLDGPPVRSDWLSGEAILVRGSALREVGLLNEHLFFWAEDLEWSLRATKLKFELWCVPEVRCKHAVAGSSSSTVREYFAARNLLILLRLHSGESLLGVTRLGAKQLYWQTKRAVREKRVRSLPFIFVGIADGLSKTMRRRFPK
jgi:GT2 family glycosyltransferase